KVLDTDHTTAMIEAARETPIFIPILLGVLCGLRRGEIAALRWRSVDLDNGQLAVVASRPQGGVEKEPKNGKGPDCITANAGHGIAPAPQPTSGTALAAWCPTNRRPSRIR